MATYRAQRQARREVTEQMLEYLHTQRDSITGSGAATESRLGTPLCRCLGKHWEDRERGNFPRAGCTANAV
jgi:hypothetical protein